MAASQSVDHPIPSAEKFPPSSASLAGRELLLTVELATGGPRTENPLAGGIPRRIGELLIRNQHVAGVDFAGARPLGLGPSGRAAASQVADYESVALGDWHCPW